MTSRHRLVAVVLLLASALPAQFFVSVGSEVRQSTRATWIGRSGEQSVAIDYGQPKWRPDYEAFVLRDTATSLPLGKGAFTTLRTDVELAFGKHKLPRGRWYVGARREAKQEWSLVLFAADRVDASGRGMATIASGEPDLRVPVHLSRDATVVEQFEIALRDSKVTPRSLALVLAFGPFRLTTEIAPAFDDRRPEGMPEFALTAPGKGIETDSGLVCEVLREGAGERPAADATVRAHYTGWLADGTVFYSSLVRGEPEPLRREWVVPGFWEGLQRMRPGEVCRLTIPAALAYGEHGAGNRVPANAVLVYVVEVMADQRR